MTDTATLRYGPYGLSSRILVFGLHLLDFFFSAYFSFIHQFSSAICAVNQFFTVIRYTKLVSCRLDETCNHDGLRETQTVDGDRRCSPVSSVLDPG